MYNNNILTLGTFSNEFTLYLFVTCTSVTLYYCISISWVQIYGTGYKRVGI